MNKTINCLTLFLLSMLFSNVSRAEMKLSADLDGDGKADEIWLDGDNGKLLYQLSSQKKATKSTKVIDIAGLNPTLSIQKNVVQLKLQAMRGGSSYKFRYDKAGGDLRVIGYDSENFGPASNDGSGTSSYNLLTGDYIANWNHYDEKKEKLIALPTIKRKAAAKKYYLSGFSDEVMNEISGIDQKFLPAELR
jgi:hypothetical protein